MTRWIALSDSTAATPSARQDTPKDALQAQGVLVIELSLPLPPSSVLLDFQSTGGDWPRTLSIFHDSKAGIRLLHRQGQATMQAHLPGPFAPDGQTARLIYAWDAPARTWTLRLETRRQTPLASSHGLNPMAVPVADVEALCRGAGVQRRDPCVLWYGITERDAPPASAPWFGLRTPVATRQGLVPAGLLRPGMLVDTRDHGPLPLQSLRKLDLPARGLFAPVVLRAPFFTRTTDLLVSGEQPIAVSGLEVEYLFGEEEVLVEAGCLIDGRAALPNGRRATISAVSLDLGLPALIDVDGCTLLTASHAPQPSRLPLRLLQGYEALPLMALLKRLRPADAA